MRVTNVYIFNPQNDLALATGGINYVAPPFALRMAADLAVLPAFIAEPGSLLITDSDLDALWLEHLNTAYGLDVHAVKRNQLRGLSDYSIKPWGWCLDMRRRLLKWGASAASVPSKDEIYHLRGLSHRRLSVLIHLRMQQLLGRQLCPPPVELAVVEEVMAYVEKYRRCFIKTPWSSSGRGIYHTINGPQPELEQWCRGALKKQGSVLCEQALDKVMDLAVEFHCSRGETTLRGFSIFTTDDHSQYRQGEVASCEVLKGKITALYPELDEVVAALTQVLNEMVAPHYSGWLGVDMLLYKNTHSAKSERGDRLGIDPCVELNLRPTMGTVTAMLGDNVLAPGTHGVFTIEQRQSTTELWPNHPEPVIESNRLVAGFQVLTPASPDALYRAVLSVDE